MVREIIDVQIGQAGIQMGNQFWQSIGKDHKLAKNGTFEGNSSKWDKLWFGDNNLALDKIDVYYQETRDMKFAPRSCLVDLEPGIIDTIKASPMGELFKPDNMCFGASGAGNNFAKGHYTEGAELIDEAVDIIRRETEGCDCPQGFQVLHSIGGGTGSGMGTLLLLKIRDNYPDRINAAFSVYPSPKVSNVVVEPYNATLAIHHLLEDSDESFIFDNAALFRLMNCFTNVPKYADLNWAISLVMNGITGSLRFPGKLNGDLRKLAVNLVPFPRLHFFVSAQGPIFLPGCEKKTRESVQELTDQMWSQRNRMCDIDFRDGKFLSGACIYRGYKCYGDGSGQQELSGHSDYSNRNHGGHGYQQHPGWESNEVEEYIRKVMDEKKDDFVNWIPNNILISNISASSRTTGWTGSGTFVANTTAIKGVFQRISAQFAKLYKRRAFLHWYKGEGMDEMEFCEADKNVRDLIAEYQEKQDAVVECEWWGYSYDDEEEEDSDEDEEESEDF